MSRDLPDVDGIELVQLMAAQKTVMDHRDELHQEYLGNIRNYCEQYGVEVPAKVKRELSQ